MMGHMTLPFWVEVFTLWSPLHETTFILAVIFLTPCWLYTWECWLPGTKLVNVANNNSSCGLREFIQTHTRVSCLSGAAEDSRGERDTHVALRWRHNPSHGTHFPRWMCACACSHADAHFFTLRRIFSIKLCSLEKGRRIRARIWLHLHALPPQPDGHTTRQGSYTRSVFLGSTTPSDPKRSTFDYQAEVLLPAGYHPNLYYEDNTSNLYMSISDDTMQCSATSSETEDAGTTL